MMKSEKTYIHRRVCLCRQCGGTGSVTVYAEKDFQHQYPEHKVCPPMPGQRAHLAQRNSNQAD